jgi:CubicO group peptidase (beta-lactamase class C family)
MISSLLLLFPTAWQSSFLPPAAPDPALLRKALAEIVEHESKHYNCSMVVAVRGPNNLRVDAAAGFSDKSGQRQAQPSDPQVWGSVTKTYTGATIMQGVAAGNFGLDDSIVPLIDPLLKKMISRRKPPPEPHLPPIRFKSLVDVFGPLVRNVTLRHLMAMNSGIPDYDTSNHPPDTFRQMAYKNPLFDWGPLDILNLPWVNTGSLKFPPGSKAKMKYSSTNFMLLGLVLAQSAGADDWTDYDQRAVWQNSSTGSPIQLNFTNFAIHGPCSNFTPLHVSHFSARHWLDVCSAVS